MLAPDLLKKIVPAPEEMLPPQELSEPTLMKVAVVEATLLTTMPPLPTKAVPFGERRIPAIWLLPLRSKVAPGPIERCWPAVPPWTPCQSVFSPPAKVTVPSLTVK